MQKRLSMLLIPTSVALIVIALFIFYRGQAPVLLDLSMYQPPMSNPVFAADSPPDFDVVVIGGEPEGVAAAVSAARNGARTLLVESRDGLGGLMTYGMLNYIDMVYGIRRQPAIGGVFAEWHRLVGGDDAFTVQQAKSAFLKLVQEETNMTLLLNTTLRDIEFADDAKTVVGIHVTNEHGDQLITGERFIDATQDADFAAMAGAPYDVGGADLHLDRRMAVTLMMHFGGVDWRKLRQVARRETFGEANTTSSIAWGFTDLHQLYKPVTENTRLRGLNIVRVFNEAGEEEVYINALQLFGVDGLNDDSLSEALERGRQETNHVLAYLQNEFPGFEHAEILSYPEELYVRETRHVRSEYMLQQSDIWTHRDHWDSIGYGGYPVDVQATSIRDYGFVLSSPVQYAIPFRSLVPLEIENIVVVSRSAGYSSLAAGSARIIPTGMAVAEAGGLAAVLAIRHDKTFREISRDASLIAELRSGLAAQGAKVQHFKIPYTYEDEWFDEAAQFLLNYGLVIAGYTNDLRVEEPLNRMNFLNLLVHGYRRVHNDPSFRDYYDLAYYQGAEFREGHFERDELATYLLDVFTDEFISAAPWTQALAAGLIDQEIHEILPHNVVLQRKHGFYIAAHLLQAEPVR